MASDHQHLHLPLDGVATLLTPDALAAGGFHCLLEIGLSVWIASLYIFNMIFLNQRGAMLSIFMNSFGWDKGLPRY
jgi:hypothetical protein